MEMSSGRGHDAASRQAVRRIHSPSGTIVPLSSASGMKVAGEIRPWLGWCQRTSASKPVISPSMCACGW